MYLITGASGHTGGAIAKILVNAGLPVTALGQSGDKLASLAKLGAKTLPGDVRDPHFATTAFSGADAAFVIIPSDYAAPDFRAYQNTVIDGVIAGLQANRVRYVVTLSTVGAHLTTDSGVLLGLHDMEQKMRAAARGPRAASARRAAVRKQLLVYPRHPARGRGGRLPHPGRA